MILKKKGHMKYNLQHIMI